MWRVEKNLRLEDEKKIVYRVPKQNTRQKITFAECRARQKKKQTGSLPSFREKTIGKELGTW